MSLYEKIFCCNLSAKKSHLLVEKNLRPIQLLMMNLVGTMEESGEVYAMCRLKFCKMRNTCNLC
jgi:hypothetical protein